MESSLAGLPKEALVTDGALAYPDIVDKIGIRHQLCVLQKIKKSSLKNISINFKSLKTNKNNL